MVVCSKCGTENEDTAKYCVKCGAKLGSPKEKDWEKRGDEWGQEVGDWGEEFGKRVEEWAEDFPRHARQECFGLPNGGLIFGLVIGLLIILVGILTWIGIEFWRTFWAFIIIGFGAMILAGALYSLTRKH